MIENILILDTETNGLDPSKGAQVIEIGALLFNVHHRQVIQSLSTLLYCDSNPVQEINHIDPEWTHVRKEEGAAIKFLTLMARQCSLVIAHNAIFDKKFIHTLIRSPGIEDLFNMQWVCTKKDFKWPVNLFRYRLQDICEAMGVSYINAHRALTDCTFLAECFKKVDDLESRLYNASKIQSFNNINSENNSFR